MSGQTPLDRLAAAHGIEPNYVDIWGQRHRIDPGTQQALLQAMGVAAGSRSEIEDSLRAAEARVLARLTPETLVLRQGEPVTLPVTVAGTSGGRLSWSIITEDGTDIAGEAVLDDLAIVHQTKIDGRMRTRRLLSLNPDLQPGYHRCHVAVGHGMSGQTEIIVTPGKAYWPADLDRPDGLAGVMAPLYGLRSGRNVGVGDFADLATFATTTGSMGASFVGINPVHALFPSKPSRISPYSPSSRRFLNVLMIALDQVPELEHTPAVKAWLGDPDNAARLHRLRAAELIDYPEIAGLKHQLLEALFDTFRHLPPSSPRRKAFEAFVDTGGEPLRRQARFDALTEHFIGQDPDLTDWHDWPGPYRRPDSPAVQAFAKRFAHRVMFHAYLQWLAEDQLAHAQAMAREAGMALGLYLDLAVGVAPDGAEAWSEQDCLVGGVRIGAPPDDFNPSGQDWGLLPFSPAALTASGYRPFVDLLRRNMRHAGALRIDHVLGLARSYWRPADSDRPGAYIRYPMQDLLGLVALESGRQRCVVVGEDLGTVPDQLRTALDERGLLGCRLLYFERGKTGAFKPAATYPKTCIASIGTHDLPTLKGFWEGRDIDVRRELGSLPDEEDYREEHSKRRRDLTAFLRLLDDEGLLPGGIDPTAPPAHLPWPLIEAFHRFLGRTPAALKAVQLEDAMGAVEQANLPGTIDEHPNWRRRIGRPIEQLHETSGLRSLLDSLRRIGTNGGRPGPSHPDIAALLAGGPPTEAAIAVFLAGQRFPLCEPGWCTFAWRGEADRVELLRWIGAETDRTPLERLPETDLWLLHLEVEDEGRFEYKLSIGREGGEAWIVDPLNPERATDPHGENSVCRTFGYRRPTWSLPSGAPPGRIEPLPVESTVFGETRTERLYRPAGYRDDTAYPLVIIHDGDDFIAHGDLQVSLDNLIAKGDIPPLLAALVQTRDRLKEYAGGHRHARYLAQELLPLLAERETLSTAPKNRILLGASLGAVASLATAFRYPGLFGGLVMLSGSFILDQRKLRDRPDPVFHRIARLVRALKRAPALPETRAFVSTGELEGLAEENRALASFLRERGVDVLFKSAWDGHHWHNWRDQLRDGLRWVFDSKTDQKRS